MGGLLSELWAFMRQRKKLWRPVLAMKSGALLILIRLKAFWF